MRGIDSVDSEKTKEALGCQALLEPRVLFVVAPWDGGTARWDGNQVGIGGGSGAYGTIGALSLHLRITDADDREIFYGTGGIQPTGRLNEGWFDSKFEDVDSQTLLRNAEANRKAIDIALKDLPGRGGAKRTPAKATPERR